MEYTLMGAYCIICLVMYGRRIHLGLVLKDERALARSFVADNHISSKTYELFGLPCIHSYCLPELI